MEVPNIDEISRWLPFLISPLELEDFLGNRELYSASVPLTKKGFYLVAASLRHWLKETSAENTEKTENTDKRLVLTSRFLTAVPNAGLALLLAVDAYQPRQIFKIYAEKKKVQKKLGTVVSLTNVDKKRKTLGKVVFSLGKKQVLEIKPEEIVRILVDEDTKLDLDFRLQAAKILGKTKTRISVSGGRAGVVIDSRGRPIEPGEGEKEWEKIKRWTEVFL